MIKRLRSEYGDNYSYVVYSQASGEAGLVDPVASGAVERFLARQSLQPVWIVNTHGHGDHTGANQQFASGSDVEIYGHVKAARQIGKLDRELREGDVLELGEERLEVLHTPGHTPGSICLKSSDCLITGDTLFLAGCGNPKFGGDTRELYQSIKNKLRSLPDRLKLMPGHDYALKNLKFARKFEPDSEIIQQKIDYVKGTKVGNKEPESILGEEKRYNPFLRFDDPQLINNLRGLPDSPTGREVFQHLRQLRNSW